MAYKEDILAKSEIAQLSSGRTGESLVVANIEKKLHPKKSKTTHILLPKLRPEPTSSSTTDASLKILKQIAENSANSGSISESINSIVANLENNQLFYRLKRSDDEERERDSRLRAYHEFFHKELARGLSYSPLEMQLRQKLFVLTDAINLIMQEQLSHSDAITINTVEILRLIERQPMTLQNLADSFNVSVKDVYPLVRKLFNRGFIDKVGGNFLRKLFPFIAVKQRYVTAIKDPSIHFTLTSKGYFKLNPIITIKN
ncbi:MAG: hypothetical protein KME18_16835 [Phormidium tanganyikae FI6-MK23]|jgi:hypothetical protein|nr:hypothetical protein [Phormidium tanganyikae FI6-MK23]